MHDGPPQTKWQAKLEFAGLLFIVLLFFCVAVVVEMAWLVQRFKKTSIALLLCTIGLWGASWVGLVG